MCELILLSHLELALIGLVDVLIFDVGEGPLREVGTSERG